MLLSIFLWLVGTIKMSLKQLKGSFQFPALVSNGPFKFLPDIATTGRVIRGGGVLLGLAQRHRELHPEQTWDIWSGDQWLHPLPFRNRVASFAILENQKNGRGHNGRRIQSHISNFLDIRPSYN